MSKNEIETIVTSAFNSKAIFEGMKSDQDFFDLGASSLTVVELQIQIEKALKTEVETSVLMTNPTIDGWISAYSEKVCA